MMRHMALSDSLWSEISDVLKPPEFNVENDELEDLNETGFFEFVDGNGNLTNSSHYLTYSLMGCFVITAALICCFHNQLKQCCSICCTAKKFTPSINYNVSEDIIVVVEQFQKKFLQTHMIIIPKIHLKHS